MTIAVIALTGPRARAVTLKEVVELSQAGIGEVVLIEMDDIAYPLTPIGLRSLKAAGISDQVLLALLRSGRSADGHWPATAQPDERRRTTRSDRRRGRARAVCEPVVTRIVPVPTRPARGVGRRRSWPRTAFGFGGVSGFSLLSAGATGSATSTRREPVYYGWGGKKRPGSWNGHSETNR